MKRKWTENLFDTLFNMLLIAITFWIGWACGYARHAEIADKADAELGRAIRESCERLNQRIVGEEVWK